MNDFLVRKRKFNEKYERMIEKWLKNVEKLWKMIKKKLIKFCIEY